MVQQNRSIDPTAAAMSAIETALNLGKEAEAAATTADSAATEPAPVRLPAVDEHATFPSKERPMSTTRLEPASADAAKPRPAFQPVLEADGQPGPRASAPQPAAAPRTVAPTTPPANDDRQSVGQILRAMNVRTSRAPLWFALAASLVWAGAIGYYASTKWQVLQSVSSPQTALLLATLLGPILFFFVSATLLRRTQEMRLTARSMTEVAMRLAEPETIASQQVVTLSQTIRREVASMGDGIERALARASELETLVHAEVSNLERSYSDNERRIRSLIDMLSQEREAIIINSEQVRTAINGAQASLSQDLAAASGRIATDVETAGNRVTHSLGAKGEEISLALASTGDKVVQQISARGDDIVDRLAQTGQEVDSHLTLASQQVASALAERVNEIDDRLNNTGKALIVDLSLRGNEVIDRLDQTSERIASTISASGDGLVARLAETGDRMHETVHVHGKTLTDNLNETSTNLANLLNEHSQAANARLADISDTITTRIDTQHSLFATRLQHVGDNISSTIGEHSDHLVDRLNDGQTRLHETIMVHGRALDESLATTGENLAAIIAERTSHAQNIFGDASDQITAQLSAHQAEVADKLSAHAAYISDNLGHSTAQTLAAGDQLATQLSAHQADVADKLSAHAAYISDNLGHSTAQALAAGDQLATQLSAHQANISGQLSAHAATLSDNFASTSALAVAAISEQADTLHMHFTSKADQAVSSLGHATQELGERMDAARQAHLSELETQHEAFHSRFTSISDHSREALQSQAQYLTNHFARTATEAVTAIGTHGDRINQVLAERLNTFEETLGAEGLGVEGRIDAQTDRLTQAIDERLLKLESVITERSDAMDAKLAERARVTAHDLDQHVSAFETRSTQKTGEIAASFDALISRVDTGLETRTRALNEVLAHRALEVARVLGEGGREVTQALDTKAAEIDQILLSRSDELSRTLSSKAEEINSTLGGRATEIATTLDNRISQFEEKVVGRLDEVSATIDNRGNALSGALSERSGEISQLFTSHADQLKAQMDQHKQNMAQNLHSHTLDVAQNLEAHTQAAQSLLGDTSKTLAEKSNEFSTLLGDHAARLQSSLDENSSKLHEALAGAQNSSAAAAIDAATLAIAAETDRLNQNFVHHSGTFHQNLQKQTQDLQETLLASAEQSQAILDTATRTLDTTLSNRARDLGATLVARLNEIDATLTTRLGTIHSALGERGRELNDTLASRSQDLQHLFDTRGDTLVALLSERGNDIARELASVGEMVSHAIDNRGTSIIQQLGQKQVELTGAIDRSTHALREAMDGGANQSVLSLANLSDQLKGELAEVIDRLEATNNSLGTLVSNAGYNLSSIEGALTGRMKDFSQALGAVSNQVSALNQTATTTLQDGHALASRIDGHAKALNNSAVALAQIQSGVDATLEARRNSLEALLANVNAKTADFESMTRSFGQLVDEAFLSAEARARDIGNFLTQSTQETAGVIGAQYADVRSANEAERLKFAAQMRAAAEQAKSEIGDVLTSSLERFKTTVAEMHGMSGQIQHELELTRGELARGIGEIPANTAEQASVMRRVVAEQIKALNELTDIVVKSGRAHDLVTPELPIQTMAAPPARVSAPARPVASEPPRNVEPPFVFSAAVSAKPAPAPATSERGSGWISDLLARASTDKTNEKANTEARDVGLRPTLATRSPLPSAKPANQSQPLENLSVEIVKMVDPAALADGWDRYRRGEKPAFGRNLYTKQGLQTFEEIRRRYAGDNAFRATVDRYITEFERILGDINRDDRTGTQTRDYLISDTGKIYTLLAQASGRLG